MVGVHIRQRQIFIGFRSQIETEIENRRIVREIDLRNTIFLEQPLIDRHCAERIRVDLVDIRNFRAIVCRVIRY